MSDNYVYDKEDFRFRTHRRSPRAVFFRIVKYVFVSLSLAVLYYILFALFFSTDTERRLKAENRMFEKMYPEMQEKQLLLEDVVSGLQAKDNTIYNELFQTDVVSFGNYVSSDFLSDTDTMSVENILKHSAGRYSDMQMRAADVDADFMAVFGMLASGDCKLPPLSLPLKDFSYTSTGASTGSRINPFYKVKVKHDGLDMIAPSGTPVYASADGVVSSIERSRKGLGNVVTITHENGYVTKYAHLSDIKVLRRRNVKKGTLIGRVGMTGSTFAPHLHYEVWKDTVALDPVSYFFCSVSPEEYGNMLLLSASAGQSMD